MMGKRATVELDVIVYLRLLYREVPTLHGTPIYECRLCSAQGMSHETVRHYATCDAEGVQESIW